MPRGGRSVLGTGDEQGTQLGDSGNRCAFKEMLDAAAIHDRNPVRYIEGEL